MRAIFLFPIFLLAVFGGSIALIQFGSQKAEYSFRLALAVDVDGNTKEASSVIRVAHRSPPRWLEHMFNLESRVDGDAIFLDLGPHGHVIETLTFGPNGKLDFIGRIVLKAFHANVFFVDKETAAKHPLPPIGAKADLKGEDIPTLVTFADIGDPNTVRVVRPEDFSEVFGAGVRFRGASIEVTNAPVTRTIDRSLPLMSALRERARVGGGTMGPEFTPVIYYFSRSEN